MYNNKRNSGGFHKNNTQKRSYGHFGGFHHSHQSQENRPQKTEGGFRGNRRFNSPKRPRFKGENIDTSLFIRKAEDFVRIEETLPTNSFEDFKLNEVLFKNIKEKGFVKPTPIQDEAIPQVLAGKDVLGIANTGTGKTAVFAIPLIEKILNNPTERILIMAPTRELAQQIKQEIRSFTPGLKIYIALAIGGAYLREQIQDIKRGPNIIIGTPGRIKDLGERKVIRFEQINTLVLDEVDRMLDMGFIDDIRSIVDQIPKSRQTLFFSATVNKKIEGLIVSFLNDPAKISVKTRDTSSHVEQNIVRVSRNMKEQKLAELVANPDFKKVLIFGATQMIVDKLSKALAEKGFKVQGLHGGKPQYRRQQIVRAFRENQINILVATDVAARGLDIADITHVINYDKPNNYDDYCHRIGRTGRGNSKGFALTFVE